MGVGRAWGRRQRWRWGLWLLLGLAVGCGLLLLIGLASDRLAPPADESVLRRELEGRTAEAWAAWRALDDLWGRLEDGQALRCSEEAMIRPYFIAWRTVDRRSYPELDRLAQQLNLAIRDLHRAADGWTGVCQGGEAAIPPEVAAEARAALDRAAERLSTVAGALEGP
mgnify:CR=1 FL=1